MPPLRWQLIAVLVTAAPAYANVSQFSWQVSSTVLLLLLFIVAALALYCRRLQLRNKAMQAQQQVLQSLLLDSDDLIAILNRSKHPSYTNPAFSRLGITTPNENEEYLPIYLEQYGEKLLLPKLDLHLKWSGEAWLQPDASSSRIALALTIIPLDHNTERYLLIGHNITAAKQRQLQAGQTLTRDSQTGLFNPQLLTEYLHSFVSFTSQNQPQFALLLVKFNQLLSSDPLKSNTLLQELMPELGKCLQHSADKGNILARLNTDTFAVLVPPSQCNGAGELYLNKLAHRLLSLPDQLNIADKNASLQALVGISIYPLDGKSPTELTLAASNALQVAARQGQNSISFANSRIQQRTPEYLTLETELHKAVAQGEFDVYYQPRVSIGSNRVIGYEALLRWHSPKRGILLPQHFLSIADETGLIVQLDQLTFKTCCQQLKRWQQTGINRGRISLNIASQSFRQADFIKRLTEQLHHSELTAEHFELELHEDILLQADLTTDTTLKQLTTLGFHLTLDNFGAGVSSLSVLRQFPLHSIKIAADYIKDMEHNEQQRNITASLIRLASYLRLDIIATSIENEMQAYLLHVMGCDILQGNLFSKALPATEIPALLARENKLIKKEVG
jgi:EAL domain-containing protein (putative c-di-GMP-specific phosphodiesterase class I)/GGDEF domain-containing protein